MLKKDSNLSNGYMYSTANEKIEEKRLNGHNVLHNPYTLKFLSPYLKGREKILELGCGSGALATTIMEDPNVDNNVCYTLVDRDPAQIKLCSSLLENAKKIKINLKILDITQDLDMLKDSGPFDLIYCRWVLVHLLKKDLEEVLRKVISLLAPNGMLICDECDNRSVRFKPIDKSASIKTHYKEASEMWSKISKELMNELGNDLEMSSDKLQDLLTKSSNKRGEVRLEGTYQVILRTKDEKSLISSGYRSSETTLFKIYKKPIAEIVKPFDACAEDDNIEVEFLTQSVVSYTKL